MKDGARPFRPRFCFASRHVGVVATCIFASILQSKAPVYRRSGKNPCLSMLFANNRRCYGPTALDLQGYSRSLAFVMAPDALGYVEYSQKCTALRGGPTRKRKPLRRSMHSTERFMHIADSGCVANLLELDGRCLAGGFGGLEALALLKLEDAGKDNSRERLDGVVVAEHAVVVALACIANLVLGILE